MNSHDDTFTLSGNQHHGETKLTISTRRHRPELTERAGLEAVACFALPRESETRHLIAYRTSSRASRRRDTPIELQHDAISSSVSLQSAECRTGSIVSKASWHLYHSWR
jgi:hypothetical protein